MKLPRFKLEEYFAATEFVARYNLAASDAETHSLAELLELADPEARALWDDLSLSYTESAGHPLLRAEIATLYDGLSAEDILVFSGAEEAIFAFMSQAADANAHFVVAWPSYQSLFEIARSAGAAVSLLSLAEDEGWRLDLGRVRAALRPNTKAIVINFPHNPTGAQLPAADLAALAAMASEHGCYLFSDEVYRFAEFADGDRLPPAVTLDPRCVSLGVMSKALGLPGLRIGWIASTDRPLLQQLRSMRDYLTICSSAPSEILALIALRARSKILTRNREIAARNLTQLDAFFTRWEPRLRWVRPRAGVVAFPRFLAPLDAEAAARALMERFGVLIVPGSIFEHDRQHFRLGFGRRNLPAGLERFDAFLQQPFP
ncbi:MAG: aminotransferase class I/II-fold pyridoxal phosphate-dependent enzyme [Candidatus Eremiobacteraeota bacterium]|nr:aminotransferase class I/II-fold pyridoxal phosphate-dependent enzyme [Candidatus Eremiobacteraeota bacterium]